MKPVFEDLSESHCDYNFLDWAIERKHRYLQIYSHIKKLPTYSSSYIHMHLCCCIRDIAMKIVESEYWREALRSCHFVAEDPPTEHSPQGCPPVINPQGLPAVNPPVLSPAINPQSPCAVNPEGSPPALFYHCQVWLVKYI